MKFSSLLSVFLQEALLTMGNLKLTDKKKNATLIKMEVGYLITNTFTL